MCINDILFNIRFKMPNEKGSIPTSLHMQSIFYYTDKKAFYKCNFNSSIFFYNNVHIGYHLSLILNANNCCILV